MKMKMRAIQVSRPNGPFELIERATEAYERMMSGKARFRLVLTTGH
jgi:hypothetical protein